MDDRRSNDRRSTARLQMARSLWYASPGQMELRAEAIGQPTPDQAQVRTLFSGVSRGTERLVLKGAVPEAEWTHMKCPLQCGNFPFPVKYGYCATGIVTIGPNELKGRTVFCLHPHQETFNAPQQMLVPVPDSVPAKRAVLAANMETALNGHWDGGTAPGDRVVVVGAGVVGLLITRIAARIAGCHVDVIDPDPSRQDIIAAFGGNPLTEAPDNGLEGDLVFHTSATEGGLATAIAQAGSESRIIEMSWFGTLAPQAPLGGAFHRKRLKLISSQVGQVALSHRPRWTYRRRLEAALSLLDDPVLDLLVSEDVAFDDAAQVLPELLMRTEGSLAPVIRYDAANG